MRIVFTCKIGGSLGSSWEKRSSDSNELRSSASMGTERSQEPSAFLMHMLPKSILPLEERQADTCIPVVFAMLAREAIDWQ
jgi:hypothetical protein